MKNILIEKGILPDNLIQTIVVRIFQNRFNSLPYIGIKLAQFAMLRSLGKRTDSVRETPQGYFSGGRDGEPGRCVQTKGLL